MRLFNEFEDFLFDLRDDYGFMLPVDRLKQCLSCAGDITDVEEVMYRMQALACTNENQIDTFRSLFAQRFLGLRPKSGGEPGKLPKKPGGQEQKLPRLLESEKVQLRNQIKSLQSFREKKQAEMQEIWESIKSKESKIRMTQEKDGELSDKASGLREQERFILAQAHPDKNNPAIQKEAKAVERYLGKDLVPMSVETMIKKGMDSCNYKDTLCTLCDAIKDIMDLASKARSNGDSAKFKQLLGLVSALKSFKAAAGKKVSGYDKKELNKVRTELTNVRKERTDLSAEIKSLERTVSQMNEQYSKLVSENSLTDRSVSNIEKRLEIDRREEIRERGSGAEIIKDVAMTHRELFAGGINAVQTTAAIAELMETNLSSMSAGDKQKILSYIRANAKIFKQTLRRKSATPRHHQVDIRATMRAASRTGGEPVLIRYKKPKKSHAKVVILVDISGSCRHASILALYFMAMMNEAFPGGCQKFAFVNSLVPVDKYFRDRSADEGVGAVVGNIPTRGVYSDYGTTIHQLREKIGGSIHKDTTVIVIGDARNNRNDSAAQDLKFIADRCHQVFWLNPENEYKWDTGDSVMGKYQAAGAEAHHVQTAGDLLHFLGNLALNN